MEMAGKIHEEGEYMLPMESEDEEPGGNLRGGRHIMGCS